MKSKKNVLIQNAYSKYNSGDGLLVDITFDLLKDAIGDFDYKIVANDPKSFDADYKNLIQARSASANKLVRIINSIKNAFKIIKYKLTKKIEISEYNAESDNNYDLIISVGGGYMRGKGVLEALKVSLNNMVQLLWASKQNTPTIYLSQSVGPFTYKLQENLVKEAALNIGTYYVRDNRSANLLKNSVRIADLAVLQIANKIEIPESRSLERVYLVVRDINFPAEVKKKYIENVEIIRNHFKRSEIVIQSEGRGNNDRAFARESFGLDNLKTLKEAIDNEKGVVISVRLHGAIETMLNECPAVHLSYERKGFGAYEDLGLDDYVVNVGNFDAISIIEKVENLLLDQNNYWDKVSKNKEKLIKQRDTIVKTIKDSVV